MLRSTFSPRRVAAAAIAGVVSVLMLASAARAQEPKNIVLTTARPDRQEIHITYFQSDQGKETPVVILLHAEGSSRQVWLGRGGFGERLHNQGYAVIAVDLRKHGQSVMPGAVVGSVTPVDRRAMVLFDMEAVKDFIFKEHMAERLNMNKTAIIAPEMSAAVAIIYTELDWKKAPYDDGIRTPRGQDIRCLILLSPERNPKGLATGSTLADVGRLAANDHPALEFSMLFLVGSEDSRDRRGETKRMHRVASAVKGSEQRVLIHEYPFKYRGIELIGANNVRTKAEEHMLGILNDHLKKLTQTPWQDRRSRFDRD